ncbi:MAG: malate synthase A [Planctomycetota bacterium]
MALGAGVEAGIELGRDAPSGCEEILCPEALAFVADLARRFEPRRGQLLAARIKRQGAIDAGAAPEFPEASRALRRSDWKVADIPDDLLDRRVEITGPPDRKMVINALNSGARVFMADFEDSNSPTWENCVRGQVNLYDAVRRTIDFTSDAGKEYALNERTATLMVRPRGWHLDEGHMFVDGRVVSAALFDFGLFFFHNAQELIDRGSGPYFYLPKLENHLEARLWNDVFIHAQRALGIPRGTIRATVLIENILAAFEMDEILYELREHSAGLNCGRWDYIFSYIKTFRAHARFLLPERAQVTMDKGFLRAYSKLLIHVCHKRGTHAMGGMAAQIPIKGDAEANERALEKVRADKRREAGDGHDGTWVAHPGLVPIAETIFDEHLGKQPNQIRPPDAPSGVARSDLLAPIEGTITEHGLRTNVSVALRYLEAWMRGKGCVPIDNLMEDAATAEISRAQLWQWIRHKATFQSGERVTSALVRNLVWDELENVEKELGADAYAASRFEDAAALFERIATAGEFTDFLTLPAYSSID